MGRSDDVARFKLRTSAYSSAGQSLPGTAGRFAVTVFFLIWLAIPTAILVFMAREGWKNAQTWRWPAVPCTILRSGVETAGSEDDYVFRVEYSYAAGRPGDVEARPLTSTAYALGYKGAKDYAEAGRLAFRYAPGTAATCYVNPANPRDAVLKRNGFSSAWMALFPLLFIAIGVGGLWFTWRQWRPGSGSISSAGTAPTRPMSKRPLLTGDWGLVAFFGLFGGCGLVVGIAMGGGTLRAFGAQSWPAVPATVESSRVRSHRGDDSTTYSVDVLYRYDIDGRTYKSNRYGFMGGSSGGYDSKQKIVARLSPGTAVTAYVNPADPFDAVLVRGFTPDMLFLGLPLLFLAIGVGGSVYAARRAMRNQLENAFAGVRPKLDGAMPAPPRRNFGGAGTRVFTPRSTTRDDAGPVALKPRQSPGLKVVGLGILSVFWNGIVAVFVYQAASGWARGRGEVCLSVFLVPFVGVGLALVGALIHSFLAMFNPRVVLVLDRGSVALGDTAGLRWSVAGRTDRIHRLVLRLEGREEATYRQGTDTRTDKHTFFSLDFVDTEDPAQAREGAAQVPVPAGSMHSFSAANNKILWLLSVHGHIRNWPDVKDEYVLNVTPGGRAEAGDAPTTAPTQEATWSA